MLGTTLVVVPVVVLSLGIAIWRQALLEQEQVDTDTEELASALQRTFDLAAAGDQEGHTGEIARTLGDLSWAENVRIVDLDGRVVFSIRREEVGRVPDPHVEPLCASCHGRDPPRQSATITTPGEPPVFVRRFAVAAGPSCGACHREGLEKLGELVVSRDVSDIEHELRSYRQSITGVILVAVVALIGGIWVLFELIVRRPLEHLRRQIGLVNAGRFDIDSEPTARDEIGEVHLAFAKMVALVDGQRRELHDRVVERTEEVASLTSRLRKIDSELVRLDRLSALGVLSAKVVHEVSTPLNALSLNLQLLRRELQADPNVPAGLMELANNTAAEVERIRVVLGRFKARSRLPQARMSVESIGDLARSILHLFFSAEAEHAGLKLEFSTVGELPRLRMPGDSVRQVLINLVENAIRASSPGGTVRVEAHVRPRGVACSDPDGLTGPRPERRMDAVLSLSVHDEGTGVPPEVRERIFDPFFTTHDEGTGLGLAIVKQIVAEVGGTIRFTDREERGTTFSVEIPVETVNERADAPS